MLTRIITSIAALAVFAVALMLKPIVFTVALSAVIFVMLYECYHAAKYDTAVKISGYVCAAILIIGFFTENYTAAVTGVIALFMIAVVALHGKTDFKTVFSAEVITLYAVTFMSFITKSRADFGTPEMLLIFICAWSSDTGAYFAGTFFGKHKLIPHVSPKKTVEGAIGGVALSALVSMAYMYILQKSGIDFLVTKYSYMAAVGAAASVLSQFGDLAASAIKRDCGVKDYGKIFPGHGGFMDRFDSVMYIAPFVYYVLNLIV
mgnify:FL=1